MPASPYRVQRLDPQRGGTWALTSDWRIWLPRAMGRKCRPRNSIAASSRSSPLRNAPVRRTRVRAIHAKIANRRKDSLHQFSTRLVRRYDAVFVGNVSASALVKTSHAKSVLDAGWSAFRTMLRYKCDFAGATFAEVDEAFSTQTCSACDARSGPKGIAGLGIRVWTCSACGTVHDRNVNAAKNMLAAGRRRPAEGIPALQGVGGRQIQYPCSIEQQ